MATPPAMGLMKPEPLHLEAAVVLELSGHGFVDTTAVAGGVGGGVLAIKVRLRDPAGTRRVRTAALLQSSNPDVKMGAVDGAAETVQINIAKGTLQKGVGRQIKFTVLATLD